MTLPNASRNAARLALGSLIVCSLICACATAATSSASAQSSAPKTLKSAARQAQQQRTLMSDADQAPAAFFSIKDGKTSARRIQQQQPVRQTAPAGARRPDAVQLPAGQQQSGGADQQAPIGTDNQLAQTAAARDEQLAMTTAAAPSEDSADGPRSAAGEQAGAQANEPLQQQQQQQADKQRALEATTTGKKALVMQQITSSPTSTDANSIGGSIAAGQQSSLSMSLDEMIVKSRPRIASEQRQVLSTNSSSSGSGTQQQQQAAREGPTQRMGVESILQSSDANESAGDLGGLPEAATQSAAGSQPASNNNVNNNRAQSKPSRRVPFAGVPFSSPASKGQRTKPKASNQFGGFPALLREQSVGRKNANQLQPQQLSGSDANRRPVAAGESVQIANRKQTAFGQPQQWLFDERDQQLAGSGAQSAQQNSAVSTMTESEVAAAAATTTTIAPETSSRALSEQTSTSTESSGAGESAAGELSTTQRTLASKQPDSSRQAEQRGNSAQGDMLVSVISSDDGKQRRLVMITRDTLNDLQKFAQQQAARGQLGAIERPAHSEAAAGAGSMASANNWLLGDAGQEQTDAGQATPTTIVSTLPVSSTVGPASAATTSAAAPAAPDATAARTGDDGPSTTSAPAVSEGDNTFREVSVATRADLSPKSANKSKPQTGKASAKSGPQRSGSSRTQAQIGAKSSPSSMRKQNNEQQAASGKQQGQSVNSDGSRKALEDGTAKSQTAQKQSLKGGNDAGKLKRPNELAPSKQSASRKSSKSAPPTSAPATAAPTTRASSGSSTVPSTNGQQLASNRGAAGEPDSPNGSSSKPSTTAAGSAVSMNLPLAARGSLVQVGQTSTPTSTASNVAAPVGSTLSSRRELDRQLDELEADRGSELPWADVAGAGGGQQQRRQQAGRVPTRARQQFGAGTRNNNDNIDNDDSDEDDERAGPLNELDGLRASIPGEPLADYPIYGAPPRTSFSCQAQSCPGGYYADLEAQCQVFHVCQNDGRLDSFLCPNGTIFSQQHFVCVWWWQVDCAQSSAFYKLNDGIYCNSVTLPSSGGAARASDARGSGAVGPARGYENGNATSAAANEPAPPTSSGAGARGSVSSISAAPQANAARSSASTSGDSPSLSSTETPLGQSDSDLSQRQQQQLELLSRRA